MRTRQILAQRLMTAGCIMSSYALHFFFLVVFFVDCLKIKIVVFFFSFSSRIYKYQVYYF